RRSPDAQDAAPRTSTPMPLSTSPTGRVAPRQPRPVSLDRSDGRNAMPGNRCVVYTGPGKVEVHTIDYPKLELPEQHNRQLQHGVILRTVATNICGSDQHMVRGRTTAPEGQTLGHAITGQVAEHGPPRHGDFNKEGDLVPVPFNLPCGRCRNCKERNPGVCERVNPARAGAAY